MTSTIGLKGIEQIIIHWQTIALILLLTLIIGVAGIIVWFLRLDMGEKKKLKEFNMTKESI